MIFLPLGELNAWKILAWGFGGGRESSDEKQNETLTEAEVGTSHESDPGVVGWAGRLSQGQATRAYC